MQLSQLRHFLATAEQGSLRAAARTLGISQPALTKSLRQLEADLGGVLLTRSVRGIALTALGSAFLSRAKSIDADVRRAREEIGQLLGGRQGKLSVGTSPAPAMNILPRAVVKLRETWPEAQVRICDTAFPQVLSGLREGLFDLALCPMFGAPAIPQTEFRVELLFRNEGVIAVRKGHPKQSAKSLKELADSDWIRSGPEGGPSTIVDDALKAMGLPPPRYRTQCESFLGIPELIAASDLVAILPWQMLDEPRMRDKIARISVREKLKPTEIHLFTRTAVPPTPIVKAFVDVLHSVMRSS